MEEIKNLDQVATQETDNTKGVNQSNDLETKLAEIEKRFKAEISGLNKRNSELEKEVQKSELEKLSAKERAEKEIKLAEERIEKLKQAERELLIKDKLSTAGLSKELSKLVSGNEESEIEESVNILLSVINAESEKKKEKAINSALGGSEPKAGATPDSNGLQSFYDTAKAKNDMPSMLSIKRQAARDGINIKD